MNRHRGGSVSWIALVKTVVVHGSPPKMRCCSWIVPEKRWLFMDRPRKNCGGSWIAPGVVVLHGSPLETLESPSKKSVELMEHPTKTLVFHTDRPLKTVAFHGSSSGWW